MSTSQQENNVCQPHIDHYYLFCQIVNILYFIEKVNQNVCHHHKGFYRKPELKVGYFGCSHTPTPLSIS